MAEQPRTPLEPLLTVAEVAAYLQLSRATVYRLTWAGLLRTVRVGAQVRVPASAVAEYLRAGSTGG